MPRQARPKPADLTINSKVGGKENRKSDASLDPKSSPMNLEGIDLSSFGGDIGMDVASLPPLPSSPPVPPLPNGQQKGEQSKSLALTSKPRTMSEPETKEQRQIRQAKDDDELRPNSSSMQKIYHLRKNPGSTPELSLVGSKENVRKGSSEGTSFEQVDNITRRVTAYCGTLHAI
jgi:hypothetical protein